MDYLIASKRSPDLEMVQSLISLTVISLFSCEFDHFLDKKHFYPFLLDR